MVVDRRLGFTGGVAIASEWTGDAHDPAHWRDNHVQFEGPVVRYLEGAFVENWRQATGAVLSGARVFPEIEPAGGAQMAVINTGPAGATSEIGFAYWLMFHGARERIWVSTPYFAPDPDFEIGLHDAARRGLDVRLLIPNHHQDSRLIRYASQTWYLDLDSTFEQDLRNAREITLDEVEGWSLLARARNHLARTLREQL